MQFPYNGEFKLGMGEDSLGVSVTALGCGFCYLLMLTFTGQRLAMYELGAWAMYEERDTIFI